MRQGTIQTLHAKQSYGCIRDAEGTTVFFRGQALTPPAGFASLAVGMRVAFEPDAGPQGPRTAKITVIPFETPPVLSFEALAAYFQQHAAS
jgi:cold shock CspA family protein